MAGRRIGLSIWAAASVVLMLIGSFGPWVKGPFGVSISGIDGSNDGWVVVGAAALAVLFLYPYVRYQGSSRILALLSALAGIAAAATTIYDRNHISKALKVEGVSVGQVGWGLNVAMIASISLSAAAIILALVRRDPVIEGPAQPAPVREAAPKTKTCPDCAETVLAAARVCKYCGYRYELDLQGPPTSERE
jgi:hypothetical protein